MEFEGPATLSPLRRCNFGRVFLRLGGKGTEVLAVDGKKGRPGKKRLHHGATCTERKKEKGGLGHRRGGEETILGKEQRRSRSSRT